MSGEMRPEMRRKPAASLRKAGLGIPCPALPSGSTRSAGIPRGLLLDPDVLPGRHTHGVVIVVAHDPRTVGLCDAGVVGREQREVLRGDLLVERIPRSSLLLQRHLLDGVHLLVRSLVAEGRVV